MSTVIQRPPSPQGIPDWLWDAINDPSNVATSGIPVAGMAAKLPQSVLWRNAIDRLLKPNMTTLQQQAEYVFELMSKKYVDKTLKLPRVPAGLREAIANYATFKPYAEPHSRREFFRKAAQLPHKARQSERISTAADRQRATDKIEALYEQFDNADAAGVELPPSRQRALNQRFEKVEARYNDLDRIRREAEPAPPLADIVGAMPPDYAEGFGSYAHYYNPEADALWQQISDAGWKAKEAAGDVSWQELLEQGQSTERAMVQEAIAAVKQAAKTVKRQPPAPDTPDPVSTGLRSALDALITRLTGKAPKP